MTTATTTTVHLVRADQVRVGDILTIRSGHFSGRVTALPEWEAVEASGETVLVGTIDCEGFGVFGYADDERTVLREA